MSHDEHCGCGCEHEGHSHGEACAVPAEITQAQKNFLHTLGHHSFMPVARFTMKDSREDAFAATALAPVFLQSETDDMQAVKEVGAFLQELEDIGLITLDYDMPLDGYGYDEYKASALYKYFCATVAEGADRPGFLGNIPVLELGSIAMTEAGQKLADEICGHGHHHH